MNKYMLLPLASLAVMLSVSGCRSDTNTDAADHDTMEHDTLLDDDFLVSPPGEDILGDGVVPDYSLKDTVDHSLQDATDHLHDDADHLYDDVHDDDMDFGIPFDEMLENAHVHDSDGILTDGENARHDDFFS